MTEAESTPGGDGCATGYRPCAVDLAIDLASFSKCIVCDVPGKDTRQVGDFTCVQDALRS
jgi:hypothetical protein